MKTIKQIADELGVTKQAIAKRVATLPPTEVTTSERGAKLISPEGERILKRATDNRQPTKTTNQPTTVGSEVGDDIIEFLQEQLVKKDEQLAAKDQQLDVKDGQIKELNNRLAETTQALLVAQQTTYQEQILHSGTMQKQLIGDEEVTTTKEDEPPKVRFWERIFGRKKG